MITKFARLEFELFTKPSKSDFLRKHQTYDNCRKCETGVVFYIVNNGILFTIQHKKPFIQHA
jgi:hypothetical protein